jgi:hypothetical protein
MSSSPGKSHGINRKGAKIAKREDSFLGDLRAFAVKQVPCRRGHQALVTIPLMARE